jgi:hypothetical protein
MTNKLDIEMDGALFTRLCVIVFLLAGTITVVGLGVSDAQDQSSESQAEAAHDYCVQMGYLYMSTPSLNSGQPVCKFTETTWCDAVLFYTGDCTASYNPYGLPNPYAASSGYPQTASVHTPYGDVPAGAAYSSGTIYVNPDYGGVSEQAAWAYGAMSFLNAP